MTESTKEVAEDYYAKSRESIYDLLKLLATLATTGVAGYFFLLTQSINPPMSPGQRLVAYAGFVCMGISAFLGLGGWAADARFYDRWAESLEKEEAKGPLWKQRDRANLIRNCALISAVSLFFVGVVLSGIYAFMRGQTLSSHDSSTPSTTMPSK